MRILAMLLAAVAAAMLGIGVFAVLNLRALVGAHRDRLVAQVERIVGRTITVAEIVPSLWPLGIRFRDVTVGEDAAFGTAPFLVADSVVLGVQAWPLVHGRIEVGGVVLDHPKIVFVRDATGRWNVESLGEEPAAVEAKRKTGRRSLRLPLQWVVGVALSELHDGTIEVEDRRSEATPRLSFRHVRLHAEDVQFGATARLRLDAAVFASDDPDVHLELSTSQLGQHDVEHAPFTAKLTIDDADMAHLAAWLGQSRGAEGRIHQLTVAAEGPLESLRARVALATDDAALRVRGVPLGPLQPIAVRAELVRTRETIAIEGLHATLGTLGLAAHGTATLDPWHVALTVASEGEAGQAAFGGATIAVQAVAGQVTVDRDGLALAPMSLRVAGAPFTLRGWITGFEPPALDLHVEGRPFGGTCSADLALDAGGGARARVDADAIDLAAAVSALAPELRGGIEGRARGAAVVTGRLTKGSLTSDSLAGSGAVTVDGGRIRDVNLPDLVVQRIEDLPLMPSLVSSKTRARYAELFGSRDTVIESATLPFTIAHGRLATSRAVLINPAYQVTGDGWIDEGRALRFHGSVLLGAAVSKTLRDDVRAAKYLAMDDGRVALPFVARGRLGQVRVEPDGKRLRMRGLRALLGDAKDDPGSAADNDNDNDNDNDDARHPHDRDEPIEDRVIERLERMLHP